jgi:hypothetical protein
VDLVPVGLAVPLHAVGIDVLVVERVAAAPDGDVAVGVLHGLLVKRGPELELVFAGGLDEAPRVVLGVVVPERYAAGLGGRPDELAAQVEGLEALEFDIDDLSGLDAHGIGDELVGELGVARILHGASGAAGGGNDQAIIDAAAGRANTFLRQKDIGVTSGFRSAAGDLCLREIQPGGPM